MDIYAVIGAGGFGREIISVAREQLSRVLSEPFDLIFVDDAPAAPVINNHRVISLQDFIALEGTKHFNIAIADRNIRQTIAERMIQAGITAFSITAHSAHIGDMNSIGEGAVLCPMTTVTANAIIGKFFHANIYSYVAHDCVIGDYVTFAPNVQCNGGVVIENYAYIGTGAMIKQGTAKRPIIIGEGAIVGMGSVVTKSVPPHTTVFGNPAKPVGRELVRSTKGRN